MTRQILARIGIYGDIHLYSRNYGSHRDYAQESLGYFRQIIQLAEENAVTHLVCLGDFAQGRFHNLEYRLSVEEELNKAQYLTNNRHYCIQGNHDTATYGMTERDFYIQKGLLRESQLLTYDNINIYMSDYGKEAEITVNPDERNIMLAHNFFRFLNADLPMYGEGLILDTFVNWYGTELIITGHIHESSKYRGYIVKNGRGRAVAVFNVGCPCRLSYKQNLQTTGNFVILEIFRDAQGKTDYSIEQITFDLLPLEESFNLPDIETKAKLQGLKQADVSDIARELDRHERFVGDPVQIINSLTGIKPEYKKKAIELLHAE